MTIRQASPYLHNHVITTDKGSDVVTVSCSKSDCEWTTTVPVGPNGAQKVFAEFTRHLRQVMAPKPVARLYSPGAPSMGHVNRGFWHPGQIDGCPKCS